MKHIRVSPLVILVLFFCISCGDAKILFHPDNEDWFENGDAKWLNISEEIVGSINGGSGYVMTKDVYKDFILELEFYPDKTINSGVFIRCKNFELSHDDCYEINIWDEHPNQKNRTGAIVSRTTPLAHVNTLNKWNMYKIKMQNNHLQVWVNGILISDLENDELSEGYIGLQSAETGTIKFRNVKIKVL